MIGTSNKGIVKINNVASLYVGGITGYTSNSSNIQQSYSIGDIIVNNSSTKTCYVGGLVGQHLGGNIKNTYSTSKISGTINAGNVGSLVGYKQGNMYASYAVGKVEVEGTSVVKGGLIGDRWSGSNNITANSYWSPEATGLDISAGGESKSFESMLYKDTFETWDFDEIWGIKEGETLPYLLGMGEQPEVSKDNYEFFYQRPFDITAKKTGTDKSITGATIGIFDSKGNKLSEKITGEEGTVSVNRLEVASYYYKELSVPEGYEPNGKEYHFTVNDDRSVTFGEGTDGNCKYGQENHVYRQYSILTTL